MKNQPLRMKILLSAYACRPGRGSEPGIGWHRAVQAARFHDVWVLTRTGAREAIEASRPASLHPVYVDLPRWARFWERGWMAGWIYYYLWQALAFRRARELHGTHTFDLAHHVTYASWRVPSLLWRLNIPFIWGPLGGGQSAPRGFFLRSLGFRAWLGEAGREVVQAVSRWDPLVRIAMSRARRVLSANSETARFILSAFGVDSTLFEAGIEVARYEPRCGGGGEGAPLRLLWVGLMRALKNLPLLLRAAAALGPELDFRITVVGDGREQRRWELLSRSLGLENKVRFAGRLTYSETQQQYREADIFVFTSLRDTSGIVLLEAMASGLPVICLNCGGPADIVTEDCGIKIRPDSPEQAAKDLAAAIRDLAGSRDRREAMGRAGRKRAEDVFDWSMQGERMDALYREVVASR